SLIAKFGGARNAARLRQRILDRAHYDLALTKYSIDCKAHRVCLFTNYQHMKLIAALVIHLKDAREAQQRKNFSAIGNDFVILEHLRRSRFDLHHFAHRRLWHRKPLPVHTDDEGFRDRERQRQLDREGGSVTDFCCQRYSSAEFFDRFLNHVHPHAAATL